MPESWNKQKQRSAVETSTAWLWLDKHIYRAMNMLIMIEELLEAVSMWPVPKLLMVMGSKGHRNKKHCAGKGQQQFTQLTD
jgi:hypothetical protein